MVLVDSEDQDEVRAGHSRQIYGENGEDADDAPKILPNGPTHPCKRTIERVNGTLFDPHTVKKVALDRASAVFIISFDDEWNRALAYRV